LGFGVWGLGFGVWGLGFGVWGLGFGVWGLGFGVLGFGFAVLGVLLKMEPSQEWAKVIPLLTIETVHGAPPHSPTSSSSSSLHVQPSGDPQLLTMWRRGLPASARGALWCMAIGNVLGLTDDDFDARVDAAAADAAAFAAGDRVGAGASADCDADGGGDKRETETLLRAQIEMDLQRTMPTIGNFSRGGDLEAPLRNVLLAYAHTRPHLSYVQGMSHIAAALLLVMPPPRAWACMVNLLDAHHFQDFYSMDIAAISVHSSVFGELLQQFMPEVAAV